MVYFDHILHTYACQHSLLTYRWRFSIYTIKLVKILITLEPYRLFRFGSNFAYLFILILSSHWFAKTVTRLCRTAWYFNHNYTIFICVHVPASSQSMRFILSLRLYSSFITSEPGHTKTSLHSYTDLLE